MVMPRHFSALTTSSLKPSYVRNSSPAVLPHTLNSITTALLSFIRVACRTLQSSHIICSCYVDSNGRGHCICVRRLPDVRTWSSCCLRWSDKKKKIIPASPVLECRQNPRNQHPNSAVPTDGTPNEYQLCEQNTCECDLCSVTGYVLVLVNMRGGSDAVCEMLLECKAPSVLIKGGKLRSKRLKQRCEQVQCK